MNKDAERLRSKAAHARARARNVELGAALAEVMDESGLTSARLGELLGTSSRDVQRWRQGDYLVPAVLVSDTRLPESFRLRLQERWTTPHTGLVRDELSTLARLLESSSVLAQHLVAQRCANDNAEPAPAPAKAVAAAQDAAREYLRSERRRAA